MALLLKRLAILSCLALIVAAAPLAGAAPRRPAPPAHAAANPAGGSGWTANATAFRGQDGARYDYTCPSYGTVGSVYGTDVYTDDSSVCTAGVHLGVISLAGGGTVTIEIRPGEAAYTGSTRNRVTSSSYSAWGGSYVIVGAEPVNPGVGKGGDGWAATATSFRTFTGAQFSFNCPKGGPLSRGIWGTHVYTDDSSICAAAVHVGLITVANGGKVVIEMRQGEQSYSSSKRHGITSAKYGPWPASFVVVGDPDEAEPSGIATGDVTLNGQPFTDGPVPYGSTVDVTSGTLKLTATGVGTVLTYGDGTDLARYVLKKATEKVAGKKRITAELALTGGDLTQCSAAAGSARAAASTNQKVVRSLWASGKGKFRTKGRFASATIRGTIWQTTDRCDGTLTTVKQGSVVVRDIPKKTNVVVKAPNSYLALGP